MNVRRLICLCILLLNVMSWVDFFLDARFNRWFSSHHSPPDAGFFQDLGAVGRAGWFVTHTMHLDRTYLVGISLLLCFMLMAIDPHTFFKERTSFYTFAFTLMTLFVGIIIV
jgi:hypothetical protein